MLLRSLLPVCPRAFILALAVSVMHCAGGEPTSSTEKSSTTGAGIDTSDSSSSTTSVGTGSVNTCALVAAITCPSKSTDLPSYATDIVPIVNTYCQLCHSAGGPGAAVAVGGKGGAGKAPAGFDPNGMSGNPNRINGWDPSNAHNWSILSNLQHAASDVYQQVFLCNMPPNIAPSLPDSDRTKLMTWVHCGAPNN